MRIAPHLVHPLPILVPTYGHGLKGKEAMFVALKLNDLISCDRNQGLSDPKKHIPPGRVISRQSCQQQVPGIADQGLTGAATFHDAQVYNSERLTLAFVKSAAQAGATVANYVEATGFLQTGDQIQGIMAQDKLTGEQFDIQAKAVVNTSGPWLNKVLNLLPNPPDHQPFAKAVNVVLQRPLLETPYAVAFSTSLESLNSQATKQTSRMLFVVPWRGTSMIGTHYSLCNQSPDSWQVDEAEIFTLLQQINQAYPPAQLTRDDVVFVHGGLLPQSGISSNGEPSLAKRYCIRDHAPDGYRGLLSVTGVKYTTARDVAQKVTDYLFRSWGQLPPPSTSTTTPLVGGDLDDIEDVVQQAQDNIKLEPQAIRSLVYNYGSAYSDVVKGAIASSTQVITAQVRYAVREEMAKTLKDVIFRRTDLGSAGLPAEAIIRLCGEIMAEELGWSQPQTEAEITSLRPADTATNRAVVTL
jgi:glycerol-3-phosphate dehydrogenase